MSTILKIRLIVFILITGVLLTPLWGICKNKKVPPRLIITSDIHLSNPQGRWPNNTKHFSDFLKYLSSQGPTVFFCVGDLVDNFDGHNAGNEHYWLEEINLYKALIKENPLIQFYQSFGVGHDYGSITRLEKELTSARKGAFIWEGITFIWFNIDRGGFSNASGRYINTLNQKDYQWLSYNLEHSKQAVLLFHVPIRTQATFAAGQWGNDSNLTIDYRDSLYDIIKQNRHKLLAIFNGHIHKTIKSEYIGVPIYLCPFIDRGSYCVLIMENNHLIIKQFYYDEQARVYFPK